MLKSGDKVKIREDLKVGGIYRRCELNELMGKYLGLKTEIIREDRFGNFKLNIDNECWHWSEDMLEKVSEGKMMKKDDLMNGAVLVTRDGRKFVLLKGRNFLDYTDVMFSLTGGFEELGSYNDDLKNKDGYREGKDIVKVYQEDTPSRITYALKEDFEDWSWERKEEKEVTMAEIEEKFGCKVKIIK